MRDAGGFDQEGQLILPSFYIVPLAAFPGQILSLLLLSNAYLPCRLGLEGVLVVHEGEVELKWYRFL